MISLRTIARKLQNALTAIFKQHIFSINVYLTVYIYSDLSIFFHLFLKPYRRNNFYKKNK